MKILLFGGTRFIGRALVPKLLSEGHELTLFTRGKQPIPKGVFHVKGDRNNVDDLKSISGNKYDVVIDSSGRKLLDTQNILEFTGVPNNRFLYISSAGVYASSEELPIDELGEIDPNSRHYGKVETEDWLKKEGIPFTSFRPTYIYGAGNYNPIEKWFFDRITYGQPIALPGDGQNITQLGHVSDLAEAIKLSLTSKKAENQVYNCSGKKSVTFIGLVHAAVKATNKNMNDIQIKFFDPSKLEPKARKFFPIRMTNFFTDVSKLEKDLSWKQSYDIYSGFKDSYINDYLLLENKENEFSIDSTMINS